MSRLKHRGETASVIQAATRLAEEIARIQAELADLLMRLTDSRPAGAEAGEQSWEQLRKRRITADRLFAELAETVEDWTDVEAAEKALAEAGESVPWEELKDELDRS